MAEVAEISNIDSEFVWQQEDSEADKQKNRETTKKWFQRLEELYPDTFGPNGRFSLDTEHEDWEKNGDDALRSWARQQLEDVAESKRKRAGLVNRLMRPFRRNSPQQATPTPDELDTADDLLNYIRFDEKKGIIFEKDMYLQEEPRRLAVVEQIKAAKR